MVTVQTATGGSVSILLSRDTKYLTVAHSDLNDISTGSYIGAAAKDVGDKLVALDVLIFPPSMTGANEGHFAWDKLLDTTLSGGTRASSTMTNGSVAAVAGSESSASVDSTMTNGSIATATAKGGTKQLTVTYKGGEQTIFVPPTAPIVKVQPGAVSDLKIGDGVFVNAIADGGKDHRRTDTGRQRRRGPSDLERHYVAFSDTRSMGADDAWARAPSASAPDPDHALGRGDFDHLQMLSGWAIYNASPSLPFIFPRWMTLGEWLAGAIAWHISVMWVLFADGGAYLLYGYLSGHFRHDLRPLGPRAVIGDLRAALTGRLGHRLGHYRSPRSVYAASIRLPTTPS
jgi:hypothetical protein